LDQKDDGGEQEAGEKCIMRSFIFGLFTVYPQGYQMKEDKMSGTPEEMRSTWREEST
jgi:hypothetical protein